ncbi:unnamed protein product [Lampetra planeri]
MRGGDDSLATGLQHSEPEKQAHLPLIGVQVSARSDTTITVTWTEVSMDATSYVLELSDWVTFSISSFTVYGSASNFTFTGLVPGRYYSISVTVNCTGGSYVSDTVYDSTCE